MRQPAGEAGCALVWCARRAAPGAAPRNKGVRRALSPAARSARRRALPQKNGNMYTSAVLRGHYDHLRTPALPGCCCAEAPPAPAPAAAPPCFSCILAVALSSAVPIVCMSHSIVFSQFSKSPTSCRGRGSDASHNDFSPKTLGTVKVRSKPWPRLKSLIELVHHPHPFGRLLVELDRLQLRRSGGER